MICSLRTHHLSEVKCFAKSGVARMSQNVMTVRKSTFWNELMMLFCLLNSTSNFFFSIPLQVELKLNLAKHLCLN